MFAQKHAIVTGGSSGIGKATAQLLASLGSNITIIGRDRTRLETAKFEIESKCLHSNQQVITLSADVADKLQATVAVNTAIERNGLPSILISIIYPPDTDTPQLAEENKTKPPETKLITATAKLWSAEAVAKEIVKAIEKKTFAIAPGLELSILNKFHSLIAPGLNYYFDRLVAKSK